MKIDQSFIRGLLSNRKNNLLVKTIIDIGNNLQLKVVAEGIETEEQLKELINLNCHFGQGYLFSKPLTADKIESKKTVGLCSWFEIKIDKKSLPKPYLAIKTKSSF